LSFFDEGDETQIRAPRPRRTASPRRPAPTDHQQMMVRRGVALGAGLLIVILLGFGIKGCLDSQHKDALRSYARNVNALTSEADTQVSQPFFALLSSAHGKDPLNVEVQINQYRDMALQEAHQAQGYNVPSEMTGAQRDLLLALNLRADALGKIANQIRGALAPGSSGQGDAGAVIAGEMEAFLASDVIYSQRVKPLILQGLHSNGIQTDQPADAQFLPDLSWLSPATVDTRLGTGTGGSTGGAVAPGTHGHAVTGVTFGGQPLSPSPTVNRLTGAGTADFTVNIANQGSNDETGVKVDLTVTGGTGAPITGTKTIDQTKAGSSASVVIPLTPAPPTGVPLRVEAKVEPVPGEKVVSNNTMAFVVVLSK
jgi:hypothetical protein